MKNYKTMANPECVPLSKIEAEDVTESKAENTDDESEIAFYNPKRDFKKAFSASAYISKLKLIYQFFSGLNDQIFDFHTGVVLYLAGHFGFATLFLFVDLFPAFCIVWETYRKESSWRAIRFCFHPINVLVLNVMAFFNERYEATFMLIKSVHSATEAPLQIILTTVMMSMGIIMFPGTEEKIFKNAYNISINYSWWPILSSISSFLSIIFGTKDSFNPVRVETNFMVNFAIFMAVYFFRMTVWLIIAIILERFAFVVVGMMVLANLAALFLAQRKRVDIDPVNCALLSIVIPTWSIKSLHNKEQDVNRENNKKYLGLLLCLILVGNILLLLSYVTIYLLYILDTYNPWCNEDLSQLKFEEELFQKSFPFIIFLFMAATWPIALIYIKMCFKLKEQHCLLIIDKLKSWIFAFLTLIFLVIACFFFVKGLVDANFLYHKISSEVSFGLINDTGSQGWSDWSETSSGKIREKFCQGKILQQNYNNYNNRTIDGNWGQWIPNSACSVSCGEGVVQQIRKCDSPTPKFGLLICSGANSSQAPCNLRRCGRCCPRKPFNMMESIGDVCASQCSCGAECCNCNCGCKFQNRDKYLSYVKKHGISVDDSFLDDFGSQTFYGQNDQPFEFSKAGSEHQLIGYGAKIGDGSFRWQNIYDSIFRKKDNKH